MFGNDTFPYDSVAFGGTANQRSSVQIRCRDSARRQAATPVCRLISPSFCHFVKSHYPNENRSGKAVTEHGYRWATCQKHSDFILLLSFWTQGGEPGVGEETPVATSSFHCDVSLCRLLLMVLVFLYTSSHNVVEPYQIQMWTAALHWLFVGTDIVSSIMDKGPSVWPIILFQHLHFLRIVI